MVNLRISGESYDDLRTHLLADGKESIALALCGRLETANHVSILVHKVVVIPNDECIYRSETQVKWPTNRLIDLLQTVDSKKFSIIKIHSHPTGYPDFSEIDNKSDHELFETLFTWIENVEIHASVVMLPDGSMFGRFFHRDLVPQPITKITIIGSDIQFFNTTSSLSIQEFNVRTAQAFGEKTTALMGLLSIAVVGCSGTGSPTIEQLTRLGVGKIVLVDPDKLEQKNLNRIINSTMDDAVRERFKVDVLKEAIDHMGLGTEVEVYRSNLYDDINALKSVAACDIVFGCMDSVDGRHILNHLATFYLLAYFDLGVKLVADGKGGIDQIWGSVHYLQPGMSSLLTRGVYTLDDLNAASIFRANRSQYESLRKEGYIKNVNVTSPAVISVNMQVSSLSVIEMLDRLHKFRSDHNIDSAITRVSLTDSYIQKEAETGSDLYLKKFVGRGDLKPFLNMPELT